MEELKRLRSQAAHYEELAQWITDDQAKQAAKEMAKKLRREAEELENRIGRQGPPFPPSGF